MWYKVFETLPSNNQVCLVTSRKPNGEFYLPQRAQYSTVTQMFHALELSEGYPVYVTDWMAIPEIPINQKKTFAPADVN